MTNDINCLIALALLTIAPMLCAIVVYIGGEMNKRTVARVNAEIDRLHK